MIKFFRKIRQNLLNEGKTTKYFKYAIGEIVLVVIGILIALSINNWNEKQNDYAKEQTILLQLKREYKNNLIQLAQKIEMRNDIIRASSNILRFIDNPENVSIDSVIYQLTFIATDPTFDPIKNDLIESGNLHLIRNDSLKQRLSNWTTEVYQLQESELEWRKVRTEIVSPFNIKNGLDRNITHMVWNKGYTPIHAIDQSIKITTKIGVSKNTPKVTDLLNNAELEGIVSLAIMWSNVGNIQSLALDKRINGIIALIESEMKK